MSQQAAYILTDAGPSIEKTTETNDDQPAAESERHDLHRTDNDGQAVLITCRNCGRTGFPGEIGVFEYCIGQGGTAGLRTDSMVGDPGGSR